MLFRSSGMQTGASTASSVVEDRSEEIEKLKRAAEEEKEELRRQRALNVERIAQNVREEVTKSSNEKLAERERELLQDKELSLREAKRIIQETEAQRKQQASHMTSWAEQRAQEEKRLKEQALEEKRLKEEAQKKAKKTENEARNIEHQFERTPPRRQIGRAHV